MRNLRKRVVLNLKPVVVSLRRNPLTVRDAAVLGSQHFKRAASARTRNTVLKTARRMTGGPTSRNAFEHHNKLFYVLGFPPFSFIHLDTCFVTKTFQSHPVPTLTLSVRNMLEKNSREFYFQTFVNVRRIIHE